MKARDLQQQFGTATAGRYTTVFSYARKGEGGEGIGGTRRRE
jgi:hypothetical protein